MKKKILSIAFLTAILMVNGLVFFNSNFSAKAVMAEKKMANACCPIWKIKISTTITGGVLPSTTIDCETGGDYQCKDCTCPTEN